MKTFGKHDKPEWMTPIIHRQVISETPNPPTYDLRDEIEAWEYLLDIEQNLEEGDFIGIRKNEEHEVFCDMLLHTGFRIENTCPVAETGLWVFLGWDRSAECLKLFCSCCVQEMAVRQRPVFKSLLVENEIATKMDAILVECRPKYHHRAFENFLYNTELVLQMFQTNKINSFAKGLILLSIGLDERKVELSEYY